MKKYLLLILGLEFLSLFHFARAETITVPAFEPYSWNEQRKEEKNGEVTTLTSEFSTTWVNYHDGTEFKKINLTATKDRTGFHMFTAPYSFDIPLLANGNFHFSATNTYDEKTKEIHRDPSVGILKHWNNAIPVSGVLSGSQIWYKGALPSIGASILIEPHEQELRYLTVFDSSPPGKGEVSIPFTITSDQSIVPRTATGKALSGFVTDLRKGISFKKDEFRGISFKRATVWDSASPRNSVSIPVLGRFVNGKLLATKIIPRTFFDNATYPVYTDLSSTFYPDPNTEVATFDGYVYTDGDGTGWASAHAQTVGETMDDSGTDLICGDSHTVLAHFILRCIALYDTSSLTSAAVITAATNSYFVKTINNNDNDANAWTNIFQSNPASNTAMSLEDYDQVGDAITNPTKGATDVLLSSQTVGAFTDHVFTATGIGWISKTGITKLGIREGHDAVDDTPALGTNAEQDIYFASADTALQTSDPKLTVTYTISSSMPDQIFFIYHDLPSFRS